MSLRALIVCALLMAIGSPSTAHRLDEYLQAATISLEPGRVHIQLRLTPGVAVFPTVFKAMDTDRNGELSGAEQQAYANEVIHDVSLAVNGDRLHLTLASYKFPKTEDMREGRGEIVLNLDTETQHNGSLKLTFENHHQIRTSVYMANCLVPESPDIRVSAQRRNYTQSRYELDYAQSGVPEAKQAIDEERKSPSAIVILGSASFVWLLVRPHLRKLKRIVQ